MRAKPIASVSVSSSHIKEVTQALLKLKRTKVYVGIADSGKTDRRKEGPITNSQLGYIHEHGSPAAGIPARPFLRPGVEAGKERVIEDLRLAMDAAIQEDSARVRHNLEAAGSHAVSEVKKYMRTADFEPLKPSTIRNRNRSRETKSKRKTEAAMDMSKIRPLQNTGQLLDSIDYYVEEG